MREYGLFVRGFLDGSRADELADELGMNRNAIYQARFRGFAALRKCMETGGLAFMARWQRGPADVPVADAPVAEPSSTSPLASVGDPAPLRNSFDPTLDAFAAWRGGGLQVRVSTDREQGWPVVANSPNYFGMRQLVPTPEQKAAAENPRLAHLTMWFHAPSKTPCLTIAHGMLVEQIAVNPSGFRGGFAPSPGGRGYTLEYAIPWRLLNCDRDPPRPGDLGACGVSMRRRSPRGMTV